MKRGLALLGIAMFLGSVCIFSSGCAKKEAPVPVEQPPEVTIKQVTPVKVVSLAKTGPYSKIGEAMGELFAWVEQKKVEIVGPPMGIFYDDPAKVDSTKTRYEICAPVTGPVKGDRKVKVKDLPPGEVATIIHKGPYEQCMSAYEKLDKWIMDNNYEIVGAACEIYLNDPNKVPPDSLLTEIQFPVKKKEM